MVEEQHEAWLVSNRASKCRTCETQTQIGERVYWVKGVGIYCKKCAAVMGKPTEGVSLPNSTDSTSKRSAEQSTTTRRIVHCDCCGDGVETLVNVQRADWGESYLCARCVWLMKAQFKLKVLGLWRPTPKPSEKVEP